MEGWISLYRKFIDWEWYRDTNVKVVFIHLLLSANHKDNKWQGETIKRGQLITSYGNLAKELKLTVQQIRTALNKLNSTGEITIKTTNKYSLVTILKYNDYQDNLKEDNTQINTRNNKRTTNK